MYHLATTRETTSSLSKLTAFNNADYLIASEVIIVSHVILQGIGKIGHYLTKTKCNKCESCK